MREMLQKFCKEYEHIYCYGAGEYGTIVGLYLNKMQIPFEGFIVSSGATGDLCGIKIYNYEDVKAAFDGSVGLIMSISKKNHIDVIPKLDTLKTEQILFMEPWDFANLEEEISDQFLRQDILMEGNDIRDNQLIAEYNNKIRLMRSRYKKIEVQYMNLSQMGGLIYWIKVVDQIKLKDKDIYYVYFPYVYKNKGFSIYNMPNQQAFRKCIYENLELISDLTIDFWKYFLQQDPFFFEIKNGFATLLMPDKMNKFAVQREQMTGKRYMKLSDSEELSGKDFLKSNGIEDYVCIAIRNSAYRRDVIGHVNKGFDDADFFLNSSIEKYEPIANSLKEKNIKLVRMGAKVEEELPQNSEIFDYAGLFRTELMDLFLSEHCKFMVGDPSGILVMPLLFGRPIVMINLATFTVKYDCMLTSNRDYDLMIIQKLWDKKKNRFLTIREMIEYEVKPKDNEILLGGPMATLQMYHEEGIIPYKNTSEEIYDVMCEMLDQINGVAVYDELDLELRSKYNQIVKENSDKYFVQYRIGKKFLRENQWLLD